MQLTKKEMKYVKRRRSERLRKEKLAEESKEVKAVYITFPLRKKGSKSVTWICKVRFE